jgi:hypothetical protein
VPLAYVPRFLRSMDRQSKVSGLTQYSSLGLISTSGMGSNLVSSNGGIAGSDTPKALRCAFAFSRPQ